MAQQDLSEKLEAMMGERTLYTFCAQSFTTIGPRQIENLIDRQTRPKNVRVITAVEIIRASRGKITWKDFVEDCGF